jgi:hypothetical protein
LNAVVRVETALSPEALLDACKAVGREPGPPLTFTPRGAYMARLPRSVVLVEDASAHPSFQDGHAPLAR